MAAVRRTAVLILMAALLGAAVWLVTQKTTTGRRPPALPLLLGPAVRQSRSLAVTFQGTSRSYRQQGGAWRGSGGSVPGAPIRSYLHLLSVIRPQAVEGRYNGQPVGYGFGHPLFRLQAVLASGRRLDVLIGRSTPNQAGYYAQVNGTGPVVVVGISDVDNLTVFAVNGP